MPNSAEFEVTATSYTTPDVTLTGGGNPHDLMRRAYYHAWRDCGGFVVNAALWSALKDMPGPAAGILKASDHRYRGLPVVVR
jgi:hypothetical protein